MSIRLSLLGAAALSVAALPAAAQGLFSFDPAEGGWIASGYVGAALPGDAEYSGRQTPAAGVPGTVGAPARIDLAFDNTAQYGATIGYQLPFKYWTYFQPRLELEVSRFEADLSSGSFNGGSQSFRGNQSATSYLINNYSDVIWKENQKWVPFVGGGIGATVVDADVTYSGNPAATAPSFGVQTDTTAFTTTFGAGVTYRTSAQFEVYGEARATTLYNVEQERRFLGGSSNDLSAVIEDDTIMNGALIVGARARF